MSNGPKRFSATALALLIRSSYVRIRRLGDPLDSVTCKIHIAGNAMNPDDAVDPCPLLHARMSRPEIKSCTVWASDADDSAMIGLWHDLRTTEILRTLRQLPRTRRRARHRSVERNERRLG